MSCGNDVTQLCLCLIACKTVCLRISDAEETKPSILRAIDQVKIPYDVIIMLINSFVTQMSENFWRNFLRNLNNRTLNVNVYYKSCPPERNEARQ